MGELKPIGSEKLKGDEKIQRILELTYYQSNDSLNESKGNSIEATKNGKTGIYGIEKEKDGYYVKKGLNENSLDYIGGLFMKNKNRFPSFNEALKKMEFLVEQEIAESKVIEEATKYVLKQPKPSAPSVAPAAEEPVAPVPAEEPVEPEMESPLPDEDGDNGELPDEEVVDYMKILKKLAGKLQQKINEYEDELDSSEYKEIIKQILSAVDVNKLEESDIEEILSVFEDEEVTDDDMDEVPTDDVGDDPIEASETDDIDGVDSLDNLINTPLDEYNEFEDDEDDILASFDDSFLDDEEIKKAEKVAKKDHSGEIDAVDFDKSEIENFPIYKGSDETDLEEELPIQGMGEEPSVDQGMGPIDNDNDVRELDLDELTDMVNNSVKDTLGKYFK